MRCAAVRVVQRGVVRLMRGVVVVVVRLVVVHCGGGAAGCGALSQRMAFPWHSGVSFGCDFLARDARRRVCLAARAGDYARTRTKTRRESAGR